MYYPTGNSKRYSVKLLDLVDHGLMYEVLPYIFIPEQFIQPSLIEPVRQAALVFVPFPVLKKNSDTQNTQEKVGEQTFYAAIELLRESISHGLFFNPNQGDVFEPITDLPALIAHAVHLYQVDKLGVPYIDHPKNVARNTEHALISRGARFGDSHMDTALATAWLHDVLEDSSKFFYREVASEDLFQWGINIETIEVVKLMTRTPEQSYSYYDRLLFDPVGRTVKLADIAHNLNSLRISALEPTKRRKLAEKYSIALNALDYHPEQDSWFKPLVESTERVDCTFATEEAESAFKVSVSGDALPERLLAPMYESDFSKLFSLAKESYSTGSLSDTDSDFVVALALFWQFYLLELDNDSKYNSSLVAEFYNRKKLQSSFPNVRESSGLFDFKGLTIAEIILRTKRAASNLEKYNRPPLSEMNDEQMRRNYLWFDLGELSRDQAAELLFVAFIEYEAQSHENLKIYDIKRMLINCLELIGPKET